jgi:hypothetical protein
VATDDTQVTAQVTYVAPVEVTLKFEHVSVGVGVGAGVGVDGGAGAGAGSAVGSGVGSGVGAGVAVGTVGDGVARMTTTFVGSGNGVGPVGPPPQPA